MRPRDVLAENLKKLMAATPGRSTFPQLTKAGGGSNGTLDRIRRKTLATSVDNLEPLAHAYGLEPWQLLVPTLTATPQGETAPAVAGMPGWPFSRVALARYLALSEEDRAYVEGKLEAAIETCELQVTDADRARMKNSTGSAMLGAKGGRNKKTA